MTKSELTTLLCDTLNGLSELNAKLDDFELQNIINKAVANLPEVLRNDFYENSHFSPRLFK